MTEFPAPSRARRRRRMRRLRFSCMGVVALAANGPLLAVHAKDYYEDWRLRQGSYTSKYGMWTEMGDSHTRSVHAAVLRTGKVLLVAGSGNDQETFDKGTFKTVVWDPEKNTYENVPTPVDFFCAGHSFLPDGRLLVAGGTKKYEVLAADSPDGQKHEYEGIVDASIFDPVKQTYEKVSSMNYARWYPTLVTLADGTVVSVAGLDGNGNIDAGHTETYNPTTDVWTDRKDLNRVWPTYPSLSLTASGQLFYSGANTGYGDQKVGRTPGLWDLATNAFTPFADLPDATLTETSMSVLLPPAQDQTYAIFGGGGVGDSPVVTARTATIDLKQADPTWVRGPDLTVPKRYPDVVTLPDDSVLVTNGAEAYRDKDSKTAEIYHPDTRSFTPAADPKIGRNYHTEAVLLPDGRVATFGSNPLQLNAFETRVEVYSPPYLFNGPRPEIQAAPEEVGFGTTIDIAADQNIAKVRLVRPSAVTHMTDTEQRSVAADIVSQGNGHLKVAIPTNQNILPSDWYMMFVVNDAGVPSVAKWVHVG